MEVRDGESGRGLVNARCRRRARLRGVGQLPRLRAGGQRRRSHLYGLATADLASSFDIRLPKPLESSPAVADGVVYVGCQDGNLYAYSLATDQQLWNFWAAANVKQVNQVNSSPVVSGGVVYVGSGNGTLFALSTAVSGA